MNDEQPTTEPATAEPVNTFGIEPAGAAEAREQPTVSVDGVGEVPATDAGVEAFAAPTHANRLQGADEARAGGPDAVAAAVDAMPADVSRGQIEDSALATIDHLRDQVTAADAVRETVDEALEDAQVVAQQLTTYRDAAAVSGRGKDRDYTIAYLTACAEAIAGDPRISDGARAAAVEQIEAEVHALETTGAMLPKPVTAFDRVADAVVGAAAAGSAREDATS